MLRLDFGSIACVPATGELPGALADNAPAEVSLERKLRLAATMLEACAASLVVALRMVPPGPLDPNGPEARHPRQQDWRAREAALVLRGPRVFLSQSQRRAALDTALMQRLRLEARPSPFLLPTTHASWLAQAPYRLVLGAGFVDVYQHLGRMQALAQLGLGPHDIVGYGAGAVVGALVGSLSLASAERAIVNLSVYDFFDLSWRTAWSRGGLCRGRALDAKLRATLVDGDDATIEGLHPPLAIAVYDSLAGRTELRDRGPLVPAVRQSAALPLMFGRERYLNGGWIDHHGRLAMAPGQRALQSRLLYAGDDATAMTRWLARRLGRRKAFFDVSDDPAHLTLCVVPPDRLTIPAFLWEVDLDKPKLARIVGESRDLTMRWLLAPR